MEVGDRVVYPMHGAGVIVAIEEQEIFGERKKYYVLKMPVGNLKLMLPVDKAEEIGIRSIIDKKELPKVAAVLADAPERVPGSWNKRYHIQFDRMKSGDICDVAAIARNLFCQDRIRRVSSGERSLLDLANQIMVSELVFVMDKSEQEVSEWINSILEKNGFPDDEK